MEIIKIIPRVIASFLWIIASLVVLLFILYAFSNTFKHYVGNYFAVIDLPNERLYNTVVEIYGEPLNIVERNENFFIAQYDGIEFSFRRLRDGNDAAMVTVRIYSSEFRFGRHRIGVGSTREEVKRAYSGRLHEIARSIDRHIFSDRPTLNGQIRDRPDGGFTVIDGITWVEFHFDEDDRVNKIIMYDNGP